MVWGSGLRRSGVVQVIKLGVSEGWHLKFFAAVFVLVLVVVVVVVVVLVVAYALNVEP